MSSLPTIFISHGSPELPLQTGVAQNFLKQLGQQLPTPKAILCISAHWGTAYPVVSTSNAPQTIHDFSGFPKTLYQINYPALGAPNLANRVEQLLTAAGIKIELSANRGLDHGTWSPLMLMYPQANVPTTQLSIQPQKGTAYHLSIGQALEPLCHEGVLIIGSGSATHNLWELGNYSDKSTPPDWVTQFTDWLTNAVTENKVEDLLNYRKIAPHALRNHPTEEHLLPLFVAMGAGGIAAKGSQIHSSFNYGVLSMAAYTFA